jgi:hypothetical protein
MLSIKGKIILTGAKLMLKQSWPDYVFDNSYNLMTLDELKNFIDTNKHLPNVPTAAAVKKEGMDVAETTRILLEKTEELTLYLLQLDERLKKLESADPLESR